MLVPSVDKLFVLSEQEVFGRKIYSCGGEGKWYEWYKRENTPMASASRMVRGIGDGSVLLYSGGTDNFCCVSNSGSAYYSDASDSFGVSFGFCI